MAKIFITKPGTIVTKMAIRAGYEAHFESVLIPTFLKPLPRASRKEAPTYEVLANMPSPEEYRALLSKHFTGPAESFFEDVKSTIEELGNELREWHDNLPEGLNGGSKADEVEEAASTIESLNWPDYPEEATEVPVFFLPEMDQSSRPKRCSNALGLLEAMINALEERIDVLKTEQETRPEAESEADTIRSFLDEVENAKGEVEGVTFPSMM
jgi:hypothetical protein